MRVPFIFMFVVGELYQMVVAVPKGQRECGMGVGDNRDEERIKLERKFNTSLLSI